MAAPPRRANPRVGLGPARNDAPPSSGDCAATPSNELHTSGRVPRRFIASSSSIVPAPRYTTSGESRRTMTINPLAGDSTAASNRRSDVSDRTTTPVPVERWISANGDVALDGFHDPRRVIVRSRKRARQLRRAVSHAWLRHRLPSPRRQSCSTLFGRPRRDPGREFIGIRLTLHCRKVLNRQAA